MDSILFLVKRLSWMRIAPGKCLSLLRPGTRRSHRYESEHTSSAPTPIKLRGITSQPSSSALHTHQFESLAPAPFTRRCGPSPARGNPAVPSSSTCSSSYASSRSLRRSSSISTLTRTRARTSGVYATSWARTSSLLLLRLWMGRRGMGRLLIFM